MAVLHRPPLLMLHGAIGAARQLMPLKHILETHCGQVRSLDFPGHGGRSMPVLPFSIRQFAESTVNYMDEQGLERVDIFGYSMGGYVALYLARHYPVRIGRICTLATKFDWNPAIAAREVRLLHPETIEEKVPHFARTLEERHAPQQWKDVLHATAALMTSLGNAPELTDEDLQQINHPVLLSVGDRDTMVSIEETMQVYRRLPNAQFAVIPNTTHPVEQTDLHRLEELLRRFMY
ncbi:MAG: alpha/beta fold hydrolase [Bacteroidota bacterium]|jgi:pimeloyl-ACP methyl ester carboxylesterase